jgi:hypothetical protein
MLHKMGLFHSIPEKAKERENKSAKCFAAL